MNLFETCKKRQRRTGFDSSSEMQFFLQYAPKLEEIERFAHFSKAATSFDVIRANIILRALMNKDLIERAYAKKRKAEKRGDIDEESYNIPLKDWMGANMADLPYWEDKKGMKIYIPILSRTINRIYGEEFEKLSEVPYSMMARNFETLIVDPFDYYGPGLYNSYFTKLIFLGSNKSEMAYYDYDARAIYFVNYQGRLDTEICLIDRDIRNPNYNHMVDRVLPVVDAYFKNDREALMKALVDNQLISSRLIYKINALEQRVLDDINRHSES